MNMHGEALKCFRGGCKNYIVIQDGIHGELKPRIDTVTQNDLSDGFYGCIKVLAKYLNMSAGDVIEFFNIKKILRCKEYEIDPRDASSQIRLRIDNIQFCDKFFIDAMTQFGPGKDVTIIKPYRKPKEDEVHISFDSFSGDVSTGSSPDFDLEQRYVIKNWREPLDVLQNDFEISSLHMIVDANVSIVQNSRLRWTSNEGHGYNGSFSYTNLSIFRNYSILFDGVKFYQFNSPKFVRYRPKFGAGLTNGQTVLISAHCYSMPNTETTPDYCEWKYAWPNTVKRYSLPGYLKDTFPVRYSTPTLSQSWYYVDYVNGAGLMYRK